MSKYIIKNCPCCQYDNYCIGSNELYPKKCQNIADCLLKQIVDKCKSIECPCEYQGIDCWECDEKRAKQFASEILQLMDIVNFTESETRLSEGKVNDRAKPEVKDLPERE